MEKQNQNPDPRLDTPSEANREKHINFLEVEEGGERNNEREEQRLVEERRRQWQEGLQEGRDVRSEE